MVGNNTQYEKSFRIGLGVNETIGYEIKSYIILSSGMIVAYSMIAYSFFNGPSLYVSLGILFLAWVILKIKAKREANNEGGV